MQLFAPLLALSALFVSQVLALEITFAGSSLGSIPPSQFLGFDDQEAMTTCQSLCEPSVNALKQCGDTDDNCLCSNATVTALANCHQCVFASLIHRRKVATDPREDSTPALAAYQTSCISTTPVNATLPGHDLPFPSQFVPFKAQFAITVPSDWDGPFGQGLSLGVTVVVVIIGAVLGSGLIGVVCTM